MCDNTFEEVAARETHLILGVQSFHWGLIMWPVAGLQLTQDPHCRPCCEHGVLAGPRPQETQTFLTGRTSQGLAVTFQEPVKGLTLLVLCSETVLSTF